MKLIDNNYLFNLEERQTKKIWKRGLGWPILKHPSNLQESIKPCLFRQKVKSATMEKMCEKEIFAFSSFEKEEERRECEGKIKGKSSIRLQNPPSFLWYLSIWWWWAKQKERSRVWKTRQHFEWSQNDEFLFWNIFFKKMGHPRQLFCLVWSNVKQTMQILHQIFV